MCFVSRPRGAVPKHGGSVPSSTIASGLAASVEGVFQPSQFVIRLLCHASKDAVAKDQSSTKPCAGDYTSSVVLVEWAMMCGLTPEMAFKVAIRDGHLEVVTFFISEYKWTEATPLVLDHHKCHVAASHGQLDCLKHLHEHGCEWDEWTCQAAAENGHLECLTYAHEHGCRWDEWTCHAAAKRDNHECLKYAHEHGCPWVGRNNVPAFRYFRSARVPQVRVRQRLLHWRGFAVTSRRSSGIVDSAATLGWVLLRGTAPWDAGRRTSGSNRGRHRR